MEQVGWGTGLGPDVETASDGYADRFRGRAGQYLLERQEQSICALMPNVENMAVLDVGGGHGQTVGLLLRRGHSVTVLGSAGAAHNRLRHGPFGSRCRLVTGDLLSFPFQDQSFDLVVSVRLISHMPAWQRLLAEMCRVARYGVIIDYPRTVGMNALSPVLFGVKRRLEGNTRQYMSFRDREIRGAFEANAFAVTGLVGQFCLPMVVHRISNASVVSRGMEAVARQLGLARLVGSPAIVRAERRQVIADGPETVRETESAEG